MIPEKIELRHLVGYLPGDMAFEDKGRIYVLTADVLARRLKTNTLKFIKPLLLPLSALTEPLPDGTIPIVELAKIAGANIRSIKDSSFQKTHNKCLFVYDEKEYAASESLGFDFKKTSFIGSLARTANQLQLFEYLYSIHADIYGLIDAGLALDKRNFKI